MGNDRTVNLIYEADGSRAISETDQLGGAMKKLESDASSVAQKIKTNWLAVSAAVAGAYATISKAADYIQMAGKAQQAEESFRAVTASMGIDADNLLAKMKTVSRGMIDDSDLMQKSVQGMMMGLDDKKVVGLLDASRSAAKVWGQDVGTTFNTLVTAVGGGVRAMGPLVQMGLVTKQEFLDMNKAVASGADEMDLYALVQARATLQAARLSNAEMDARERSQQFHAEIQELEERIGKGLISALQYAIGSFQAWGGEIWGTVAAFKSLQAAEADAYAWIDRKVGKDDWAAGWEAKARELRADADAARQMRDDAYKSAMSNMGLSDSGAKVVDKSKVDAAQKVVDEWDKKLRALGNTGKDSSKAMEMAMLDWQGKVAGLNSDLTDTDRQLLQLYNEADKLKTQAAQQGWGEDFINKVNAGLLTGSAAIIEKASAASKKAFEDMQADYLIERKTGIDKDLALVDKWMYDTVTKIGANEDQQIAIMQMGEEKKTAIVQKYQSEAQKWLTEQTIQYTQSEVDFKKEKLYEEFNERAKVLGWTEQLVKTYALADEKINSEALQKKLRDIEDYKKAFNEAQVQNMEGAFGVLAQGSQYAGDFSNPLGSALAIQKDQAMYDLKLQQLNDYYQTRLTMMANAGASEQALNEQMNMWDLNATAMTQQLKLQTYQNTSGLITGTIEAIGSVIGKNNMALFLLQKAAAIAITIVNAHAASMAALAPPPMGLGPIFGAPLAAQMLTFGYIQAGLIAATAIGQAASGGGSVLGASTSGGSGTTAASSSGSSQNRSQQQRTLIVNIHINGDVLNSYDELARKLIPALNEAIGDKVILQV
jgi:hypothetical protein